MKIPVADALGWDAGNWASALAYWQRHGELGRIRQRALEIGANRGGLSAWLASMGHDVVCSDLDHCEATARPLIEVHGVLDRVTFENIDATSIPYEACFDIVVFKSVLGGVGYDGNVARQERAIDAMHRALRSGGRLLFAENLAGSPLHAYLRKRFVEWGERWRYVTIDEMRRFLHGFSSVRMATRGVLGALGRTEAQRQFLARIDGIGVSAAVPPSWRYIVYGVATK